jgi:hypothetical protein
MGKLMIPIWRPEDAHEVYERAATYHTSAAALVPVELGSHEVVRRG